MLYYGVKKTISGIYSDIQIETTTWERDTRPSNQSYDTKDGHVTTRWFEDKESQQAMIGMMENGDV